MDFFVCEHSAKSTDFMCPLPVMASYVQTFWSGVKASWLGESFRALLIFTAGATAVVVWGLLSVVLSLWHLTVLPEQADLLSSKRTTQDIAPINPISHHASAIELQQSLKYKGPVRRSTYPVTVQSLSHRVTFNVSEDPVSPIPEESESGSQTPPSGSEACTKHSGSIDPAMSDTTAVDSPPPSPIHADANNQARSFKSGSKWKDHCPCRACLSLRVHSHGHSQHRSPSPGQSSSKLCSKPRRKKTKSAPTPVPRTDPYQAPYFFPSPRSPEAANYAARLRTERLASTSVPRSRPTISSVQGTSPVRATPLRAKSPPAAAPLSPTTATSANSASSADSSASVLTRKLTWKLSFRQSSPTQAFRDRGRPLSAANADALRSPSSFASLPDAALERTKSRKHAKDKRRSMEVLPSQLIGTPMELGGRADSSSGSFPQSAKRPWHTRFIHRRSISAGPPG